jgi:hypothetical protein
MVTEDDARAAGFESRASLLGWLNVASPEEPLYRVRFHFAGPDDRRRPPAHDADLDAATIDALRARLRSMDARSADGPWTAATLGLIAEREATRAADLAQALGRETPAFKAEVRKLKRLGLTESLEVGYRLSPRGRACLAAVGEGERLPQA